MINRTKINKAKTLFYTLLYHGDRSCWDKRQRRQCFRKCLDFCNHCINPYNYTTSFVWQINLTKFDCKRTTFYNKNKKTCKFQEAIVFRIKIWKGTTVRVRQHKEDEVSSSNWDRAAELNIGVWSGLWTRHSCVFFWRLNLENSDLCWFSV